ncbi:MAG TPA: SDR family oxidoreductase [Micromonosporaceae bacterium]|jgi:thioester reductase-like protein|nr:SDR family oxidoreductase [Micromonosporaceae bacterium]
MTAAVRTVLVTGASGVVGTALLPHLAPANVIALVHRTACPGAQESLPGDITAPGFGLDTDTYKALARRVDAVVHCAANTGFSIGRQVAEDVNVAGTRTMAQFAADAGAVLYHISTAFVARAELTRDSLGHDTRDAAARPEDYLDSKRAAERVVRDSGVPAVIVRPSVVIGDSVTGVISRFQGLHDISAMVLRNHLPLVPIPAPSRLDFLPCDVVGRAVGELVASEYDQGEVWLTAGRAALTTEQVVDLIIETGTRLGLELHRPRTVGPEMVDRLIRPVFIDPLPAAAKRRFDDLLAITALFVNAPVFPSTLGTLPVHPAPPSQEQVADAYRASLAYLAETKGIATKGIATTAVPAGASV